MKRVYYFLMVMLMALVTVGFTACGDDDDEPKESSIVGTWSSKYVDEDGEGELLIQFTKSGDFHSVEVYDHEPPYVEHGKYTVSGNKLTIVYDEDNEKETYEYSIKGDNLTISIMGISTTWKRTKDSAIEKYL